MNAIASNNVIGAVGQFLLKYWKQILVISLIIFGLWKFGQWREDIGVQKTKAHYEAILKEKAESDAKALTKLQEEYETLVNEAREKQEAAEKARLTAEKKALDNRKKADNYYDQLGDLQDELDKARAGHAARVTHSFVGLYNLAVQVQNEAGAGDSNRQIGVPEVSEAAGLDRGSSIDEILADSPVTVDEVLEITRYNFKIANTCLAERKLMKQYIDDLCKQGFCQE